MLIDTHCHLDAAEFDEDRTYCLVQARSLGVGAIVVPGVEASGFARIRALCAAQPDLYPAYGIHPLYVTRAGADDLACVETALQAPDCVAVGEIGLDGFVHDVPFATQEQFFLAQLRFARAMGLPVILHVRRALDLVLKHLRRIEVCGGIAHAFNGSRQQAEQFMAMGFCLGFGGAMTYTGSTRIRALAASLPPEAIVLETDAPDIPPAWSAGQRSTPADLERYADLLAGLRATSRKEIESVLLANVTRVLPRLRLDGRASGDWRSAPQFPV